MFRKLRRRWLAVRWRLRSHRVREFSLDVDNAAEYLGAEVFAGIVRCNVSANRLLSAMELLLVNTQTKADEEPTFIRNKSALTAWAASEMREAATAILDLKRLGAENKLRVAKDEWRRLVESARRWSSKGSEYRVFREKFTAHRDLKSIMHAIGSMSGEVLVYARLAGPKARDQYYPGADEIAWRAWQLDAKLAEYQPFAETMEQDVTTFARDLEVVMLDLFEMLHSLPPDRA